MHMEQLVKIYNTLLTISTKGEDTLVMADCLNAFRQVIMSMGAEQQSAENETNEE